MKDKIWISNKIFDYEHHLGSPDILDSSLSARAYQIFDHANSLMKKKDINEFVLIDIITTLKRSINQRIKTLDSIYNFSNLPIKGKFKGLLDRIENLTIIRPILLKKLLKIRNQIEHHDKKPPKKQDCEELLEFTWYFLKSTDSHVKTFAREMEIDIDGSRFWVEFTFAPKAKWLIKFRGWFHKEMISENSESEWLHVNTTKATYGGSKKTSYKGDPLFIPRTNQEIYLAGEVLGSEKVIEYLCRKYFQLI